ncbi:MAG TPA: DNA translocase FtsK [Candidatus Mediterraneibacter ornithocaccae]|uniref:FtsK/SpoIIIE family DNA translocase n=1 Tax=Mediterraneibacter glycyrrhizinilyticus TaxID=342942 RepID=UPI001F9E9AB7|nr:DNA translocase FtsK [Mediterraneibacter glycyrrhizinilyticus]MDN0061566.1 DNA translocase FtsK [Mediterraneibacter glycyrrhizinilyticus]HJA20857.1 DNA translocase FtsK [Candidatus Mediterraneibacter ornithocaccae]
MAAKSTKSRKNSKSRPKKGQQNTEIKGEIIILAVLAVCILLVLSNFGVGGIAGEAVSSVFFGLFGFMAYLLPFVIFGLAAFLISNKGNTHAYIKIAAAIMLFLFITAILELIFNSYTPRASLLSYYTEASKHRNAGGLTGGCLVSLLCPLIGIIGTYVVLIILSVICIILITEKSLLAPLGRQSRKAYEDAKKKRQETAAIRAKEKEERQRTAKPRAKSERKREDRRSDHKVSGVSFATTLGGEDDTPDTKKRGKRKSPDVYELIPEDFADDEIPQMEEENTFVISRAEPQEFVPDEMADDGIGNESGQTGELFRQEDTAADVDKSAKRRSRAKEAAEVSAETENVAAIVEKEQEKEKPVYHTPPLSLLKRGKKSGGDSDSHLRATALKLEQTLQNFGVGVHVTNASCGPSVTRYELQPDQGVKVSKIVGLADDIKLNLAVADLRIEAPIPGKAAVGIEVPNKENTAVMLRDLLESKEFKASTSPITFAVGKDIAGKVVVADIAKMPHLLVAGATGSGKSVCINTLIMSIIYKADPDSVKLILVDPKVVELSVYNGIPHLMIPVVTDPKKAAGALNWAVAEMEKRYKLFAEYNVRDLKGFNAKVEKGETGDEIKKKLPQIVIIIDELADLMMVAPGEVEGAICRLAQLARAAGLHLVVATQRPSVNVITGLIKANMPSRIAFSVTSGVDSRTIIDMNGAEKLLGKGDMLFYPAGYPKPVRVQGSFVSDKEVQDVADYLISNSGSTAYNDELEEHMNTNIPVSGSTSADEGGDDKDTYFIEAGKLIIDKEKASIGMLQRMFKIGFNRAARIMDQLAEAGVVGPEEGTKPRKVLMSKEEFEEYLGNNS